MRALKMALSLVIMVPGWALLGGFARLDSQHPPNVTAGMVVGALVGVFFGLVFGGVNGRWLDHVFGPQIGGSEYDGLECDRNAD